VWVFATALGSTASVSSPGIFTDPIAITVR